MERTVFDSLDENTARMAASQRVLVYQMSGLLGIAESQLGVQVASLRAQQDIRALNSEQLQVGSEQLVAALQIAKNLDVTNATLGRLETTLGDVSGLLVQQNALFAKSLKRLSGEAQEHVERGLGAFNQGWYQDCQRDCEAAIDKDPYSTIAYFFLAKSHRLLGDIKASDHAYEKCVFYSPLNAPMFRSLSLCELAKNASDGGDTKTARRLLAEAAGSPDADLLAVATASLQVDCGSSEISDETRRTVDAALLREDLDPEVLLGLLRRHVPKEQNKALKKSLERAFEDWQKTARESLQERLLSHFYREVSDFSYLAPRVREGFLSAADGRFESLVNDLAELLEWTGVCCDHIAVHVEAFPKQCPDVLRLYRILHEWNVFLVRMKILASRLDEQKEINNEEFAGSLNLGLIDLPQIYEDDRILLEVKTVEGDLLALTCYYLVLTRNGTEHFAIPLEDFGVISFETYSQTPTSKGVVVTDTRTGQTLVQGTTTSYCYNNEKKKTSYYYIDVLMSSASLMGEIHDCLKWSAERENELFAVCLLLNEVVGRRAGPRQVGNVPARALTGPVPSDADEPEIIADEDEPEIVEDEPEIIE